MKKTVSFYTLGCKLNQAETAAIAADFAARGYEIVPFGEPADVVFINTCSVTERAEQKCRRVVHRSVRKSPKAKIVVAGCYPQLRPEVIADIPGVDLILGTQNKYDAVSQVENLSKEALPRRNVAPFSKKEAFRYFDGGYVDQHTRAFLKIQDGCDYRCSYCSIPFSRGPSRSDHPQAIVARAQALAAQGFKELVLTGVHIGMYGKDLDREENLVRLLWRLLKIEGLERIRISSLDPHEVTDDLIDLAASTPRIAPHFHIALQSGDNEILRRMKRAYRVEKFQSVTEKIRSKIPHAGIGVDVIVGFPGETEEKFQATRQVLSESPVTFFHVFSYSRRAGTPAEKFPDQIPMAEKKRRVDELIQLGEEKKRAFEKGFLGKTLHVLVEKRKGDRNWQGVAENYIRVFLTRAAAGNEILPVRITEISDGKVFGIPLFGLQEKDDRNSHPPKKVLISHYPNPT
ncbi:MAG: tRNA (N(6)-L-threonylcarbamoyladenosine(37)-C(2))-methylthiotransferase MtaB [Calditrichaeota bacterium]|nr:tRNA (N(6)-L-threonylcarbamoyladenosine(37)-C(2))-methylthiotransferase MtaB [Calditrichota bacterium]